MNAEKSILVHIKQNLPESFPHVLRKNQIKWQIKSRIEDEKAKIDPRYPFVHLHADSDQDTFNNWKQLTENVEKSNGGYQILEFIR